MTQPITVKFAEIAKTETDAAGLVPATTAQSGKPVEAVTLSTTRSGTKDAASVHVGGGMMRF